ncbi:MAG: hypothetical protein ABI647_02740 [Gemmatimonadota bacterium]
MTATVRFRMGGSDEPLHVLRVTLKGRRPARFRARYRRDRHDGAAPRCVSLTVGRARVAGTQVLVSGFLTPLSPALGTELDGIIGSNFLREFRVTIDYPAARLLFG